MTNVVRRCQQASCYAAEKEVDQGRTFGSIEDVQAILDALRNESWWDRRVERVEVGTARKGGRSVGWFDAAKNAGRIELTPADTNQLIVCHELAHVLARARGSTAHDPIWARCYVELVYRIMGALPWTQLVDAFKRHGVDYG